MRGRGSDVKRRNEVRIAAGSISLIEIFDRVDQRNMVRVHRKGRARTFHPARQGLVLGRVLAFGAEVDDNAGEKCVHTLRAHCFVAAVIKTAGLTSRDDIRSG